MMSMSKDSYNKVTVKTLAEKLGLSVATIDRALNQRGNVKKATYDRIMQAVEELNYSPNKSASYLSRNRMISIAVIFQTYPIYFWEQIEIGVNNALQELSHFGLQVDIIRTMNSNIEEQIEKINEVVDSGKYDGIAISSDGSFEIAELIDRAVNRDIATCTFNTDSPISKRLFYVGCDYRDAGKLAAELLCKFIGRKGKTAFILETENMFQFQQKILGFREVIGRYDNVQMIGPLKLDRNNIEVSMENLMKDQLSEVDGIYLATGQLAAMAQYIENWGLDAALIGHDMTPEVHEYLQKDVITATICQDPHNQGYTAVKMLFDHLTRPTDFIPSLNLSKLEVALRENANFFL